MASFAFLLLTPRSPLAQAAVSHWTSNRFHRLPQPHSTILLPVPRISLGRGNVSNDVVLFGSQEGEDGGWIALQHCVLRSIEGTSLLILNRSASPSTCYKSHDPDDAWKMIRPGDEVAILPGPSRYAQPMDAILTWNSCQSSPNPLRGARRLRT